MDTITQEKWDRAARFFDVMTGVGPDRRWEPAKRALFARMAGGNILFLAAGTGLDFPFFPPGRHITAIDISPEMIRRAEVRAAAYDGDLTLAVMDVREMTFADDHFDQVFTSCTFCSVPNPVVGLSALYRVLKPGGELHMFEHTGSRYFPFNAMLNIMTPLSRRFGPEMNRDTVTNVEKAGFVVDCVENIFLDVVKSISAHKPDH